MGRIVKKEVKFMATQPSGNKSFLDKVTFEADEKDIDDLINDRINEFHNRLNKEVVHEVVKVTTPKTAKDFFDEMDQIDEALEEDYDYGDEDIPEIDLDLETVTVETETRKIKTTDDYNVDELQELKKNGEPLPELYEDEKRSTVLKLYNINKD